MITGNYLTNILWPSAYAPVWGALRLAHPKSYWAWSFYRNNPKKYERTLVRFGMVAELAALQQNMEESLRSSKLAQPQITTTRKVKFILRWAVAIIVDLVALYYSHNALISWALAAVAFILTKVVLSLWTTPADELYDAMRSGKPERIKAATALCSAADKGDKEDMKAATDALAKAIREGK
jgi:hypothetical protein